VSSRARVIGLNLLVAVVYLAVAEFTLIPESAAGRVTPMWPPAGVALAALLLGGVRLLPGIAVAAFTATTFHMALGSAAAIAIGMVLQVVVDARLLQRFDFDARLERVRDPLVFCGVTLVGAAIAAMFGVIAVSIDTGGPRRDLTLGFAIWWMRDWLGALVVGSLALSWARSRRIVWTRKRIAEAAVLVVVLVTLTQVVFRL
jgi:integral membrane sensor domain MASE1